MPPLGVTANASGAREEVVTVSQIDRCLAEAMSIAGALGVSLVDWAGGIALSTAGTGSCGDHAAGAVDAAELARAVRLRHTFADPETESSSADDVIVTSANEYHLLKFVDTPFDSSLLIHLRLDRRTANLAMARIRLAAIVDQIVPAL
jgi:hypothetical protein